MSANTVQRYKANIIRPIVANEKGEKGLSIRSNGTVDTTVPLVDDTKSVERVTREAVNAPVASVFRQRLEKLNGIIDRTLNKAESAVRLATDKDGNQVVVGADIGVMAPLLNQAHKNVEMLGRATGELEPTGGGSVSIQIMCPAAGATTVEQLPRITFADQDAIEAPPESIERLGEADDIGILQG